MASKTQKFVESTSQVGQTDGQILPAVINWKHAEADLLELQADTIDAAIRDLRRLEGMFDTRNIAGQVASTLDMLEVESSNRRNRVEALRDAKQ